MKNNYPDSLTIQQYLDGLLKPEEMHELEKQALDDPFLWDALEGYRYSNDHTENLSFLQRQLHERIVHLQENKKVFDFTWQRLSVAAAAAVLFISAGILFWMNSSQPGSKLANNSKQVEVSLTDADSLYTSQETVRATALPTPESSSNQALNPVETKAETVTTTIAAARPEAAIAGPPVAKASESEAARVSADASLQEQIVVARGTQKKESVVMRSRLRDDSMLNEVVINSPDSLFNAPLFGWNHYFDYLKANLKPPQLPQPLKGTVVLESFVDQFGELSGTRVVKSLSPQHDAEALRLFNEGPKWTPSQNQNAKRVRLEVEF